MSSTLSPSRLNTSAAAGPGSPGGGAQPAIVIDPAVKESLYALVEAQRHAHDMAVTQLMVAIEEAHREARFLRQQLNTSNEMLQDSQLQLRRAVSDKDVLLQKLNDKEAEARVLRQQNEELKQRVSEDMKELSEVREMVKHAMEETYRSRAAVGQHHRPSEMAAEASRAASTQPPYPGGRSGSATQQQQQQQQAAPKEFSPSREILLAPKSAHGLPSYNTSNVPVSHQAMKAGLSFAAVSPPRTRGDTSAAESGEYVVPSNYGASGVQFSVNRSSGGDISVLAADPYGGARPQSAPAALQAPARTPVQASVPRSMLQYGQQQQQQQQQQGGEQSNGSGAPVSFRPITVDMTLSRAISVSAQGHVCISMGDRTAHALCIYRDLRTVGPMHFEASFRSSDAKSVLIGIAALAVPSSSSSSSSDSISAASGLGARCALRGDGTMVLATEDGNVFEARSGLDVTRYNNNGNGSNTSGDDGAVGTGIVTVRLDEMTGRVLFSVGGNGAPMAVPMQVPRSISGVQTGMLVPFVSLPNMGDEVVVRAPLR